MIIMEEDFGISAIDKLLKMIEEKKPTLL